MNPITLVTIAKDDTCERRGFAPRKVAESAYVFANSTKIRTVDASKHKARVEGRDRKS